MTPNLTLIIVAAVSVGAGVSLVLERSLSRVLIGLVLVSNGVNLMLLAASGPAGRAPLSKLVPPEQMSDPLPQALVLTAIVITLGTTAFMLAMAHRAWALNGHDDVQDDVEDRLVRQWATADEASAGYVLSQAGESADEQTVSVHDEQPVRAHGPEGEATEPGLAGPDRSEEEQ
jgi:multicomponent Na+:H+ antiporter subunit C